ncbi:MAG: hypothetical protein IJZ83_07755 [Clostridia bacterium]|nr:hypothetical protein [Clostridia bacterium]
MLEVNRRKMVDVCEDAHEMYLQMDLPEITDEIIDECLNEIPIEVDREFIKDFILNGQDIIQDAIYMDCNTSDNEDNSMGMGMTM